MFTWTEDNDTLTDPQRRERLNSKFTAIGARLRRAGIAGRMTVLEFGSENDRPHHHQMADGGIDAIWRYALDHWRGFRAFARAWRPDDGAMKALLLQDRWARGEWQGKRPHYARTYQEIVMGRYLAEIYGMGHVDVMMVTGKYAIGYALKYVGKGGGRISYSRTLSEAWAYKAKSLVYAYKGKVCRYPGRDPSWIRCEIGRCERREARLRYRQSVNVGSAVPAFLHAMQRREDYLTMATASELHFQASDSHDRRAKAIRYRLEELRDPEFERSAIQGENDETGSV